MSPFDSLRRELTLLVLSRYPYVVLESSEEGRVEDLVARVAADLSLPLLVWSSSTGLVRGLPSSTSSGPTAGAARGGALAETEEPERALAKLAGMSGEVLVLFQDLHPYLDRPEVVRRLRDLGRSFAGSRSTAVLTGVAVELPGSLAPDAARLELALPDQRELEHLVRRTAAELAARAPGGGSERSGGARGVEIDLQGDQVAALARALRGLHRDEARRLLYQAALADGRLSIEDLERLLEGKRQRVEAGGILQWIEPLGGLESLGGADNLKRWIERRRDAFGESAQRFGLEPPKGLLLTGVPGTGKSLACRAIAGAWSLPLLALDPGRLFDKFVGETESNLRRALATAEGIAPAVLWIDEIEKALAEGGSSADGGLAQRIRGTLLTWMQERPMERAPVIVLATSNDVDRLPVELLRRGRFDEVFFFDLPDAAERQRIFAIHLARRERDPARFDLAELAAAADRFSGAEIEGVVVAALYNAFSARRPLATEILLEEIRATRPLARLRPEAVARIRAWGRDHARPA